MYSIYVAIALGEAVLYRSVALLGYAAFLFGLAHWYVVRFEEKSLRVRFGAEYDAYCARVGRWLPRRRRAS
jgi:protein-S-isoprenylcysteine O-methyltransferase Ste14